MASKSSNNARTWLFVIIAALLATTLVLWFLTRPSETTAPRPAGEPMPTAEWTTAPEGPAVPVTLPETPMKNVPAEDRSATDAGTGDERSRPQ